MTKSNCALRVSQLALLAIVLTALGGCGNGKGTVSEKVSYQGSSLQYGTVQFVTPGGVMVGEIDSSGTYTIKDAPTGLAKISVTCQDPEYANYMKKLSASARDPKIAKPDGKPEDFYKIPGKYTNPETSELAFEVKSGSQTFNIELK